MPGEAARRSSRKAGRASMLLVAGVLLAAGAPAAASSAAPAAPAADPVSATLAPSASAWFLREQPSSQMGVAPPAQLPDPSVAAGDLPVAGPEDTSTPPRPAKESYLRFDLPTLPAGSTVSSFVVTVPVAKDSSTQAFPPGALPDLVAAKATGGFLDGAMAAPFAAKPDDDLANVVKGTADNAAETYAFDLTPFAQAWVDGEVDNGIGFRPAPGSTAPFQVVFATASMASATLLASPPGSATAGTSGTGSGSAAPLPAAGTVAPGRATAPAAASTGGSTGAATGGATVAPAAPPAGTTDSVTAPLPVDSAPTTGTLPAASGRPATLPAPALPAAGNSGATAVQQPVAQAGRPTQLANRAAVSASGVDAGFVLAGLLVLGLLALTAVSLAAPTVPAAPGRRQGGVSRALRARAAARFR